MKFLNILVTTITLFASSVAATAGPQLLIKWTGKGKVGDEYTFDVLGLPSGRTIAGPYVIQVTKNGEHLIGLGNSAWVCVTPHEGSRALGKSWLVLDDGRGYPLLPDESGKLCTPNNVDAGSEEVMEFRVNVIR